MIDEPWGRRESSTEMERESHGWRPLVLFSTARDFLFFFFFKISIVINYPASPGKGWILNKANEKTAKKNNDTVGDDIYRTATIPLFIHAQKYVEFWLLGHY